MHTLCQKYLSYTHAPIHAHHAHAHARTHIHIYRNWALLEQQESQGLVAHGSVRIPDCEIVQCALDRVFGDRMTVRDRLKVSRLVAYADHNQHVKNICVALKGLVNGRWNWHDLLHILHQLRTRLLFGKLIKKNGGPPRIDIAQSLVNMEKKAARESAHGEPDMQVVRAFASLLKEDKSDMEWTLLSFTCAWTVYDNVDDVYSTLRNLSLCFHTSLQDLSLDLRDIAWLEDRLAVAARRLHIEDYFGPLHFVQLFSSLRSLTIRDNEHHPFCTDAFLLELCDGCRHLEHLSIVGSSKNISLEGLVQFHNQAHNLRHLDFDSIKDLSCMDVTDAVSEFLQFMQPSCRVDTLVVNRGSQIHTNTFTAMRDCLGFQHLRDIRLIGCCPDALDQDLLPLAALTASHIQRIHIDSFRHITLITFMALVLAYPDTLLELHVTNCHKVLLFQDSIAPPLAVLNSLCKLQLLTIDLYGDAHAPACFPSFLAHQDFSSSSSSLHTVLPLEDAHCWHRYSLWRR